MSNENKIVMIETGKLCPHPLNPRKELGDLTELSESIKSVGILQNLTVVPWFNIVNGKRPLPGEAFADAYYVLCGNRRYAAGKKTLKESLASCLTGCRVRIRSQ